MYKYGRTVPEFVKNYRNMNKLSQLDLASLMRVHPQYISNVERGTHKDPKTFCARLGKLLNKEQWAHLAELLVDSKAETVSEELQSMVKTKIRRANVKKT